MNRHLPLIVYSYRLDQSLLHFLKDIDESINKRHRYHISVGRYILCKNWSSNIESQLIYLRDEILVIMLLDKIIKDVDTKNKFARSIVKGVLEHPQWSFLT